MQSGLYNAETVINEPMVYLVPYKREVDTFNQYGLPSICPPEELTEDWQDCYTEFLKGRDVVIIYGNNDRGYIFSAHVKNKIGTTAKSTKILSIKGIWPDAPDGGNVVTFFEHFKQNGVEMLLDAVARTEPCARSENTLPGNVPEKKKAENGIKIVPARTLLKANLPPVKYHVAGMLPQGTAILSAPSKTGKSWLVLDMGLTIAAGGVFMGHMTNQCGVLYLALEDSWNRLQDRMTKILKGKEAPENFYFATKAPTLDNGLLKFFDGHLKQHPGTDIFVIDTLQKIRGRAMAHESAYAQDYREMGTIKDFMDKHRKTVLFVHHNRKMKDEDDPFNMISGTNAIMGAADTAMVMTKAKRSDKQVTLSITGRDVLESSTVVSFNLDTYKWEAVGSIEDVNEQQALQEYQNSNIVKTIKTLLKQSPDGRWSGKAKDLMSAGVYITQTHLAPTPQKMGHELKALDGPLRKYDGIVHVENPHGTAGKTHHFYYSVCK